MRRFRVAALWLGLAACGGQEEQDGMQFQGEEVEAARQGWSPPLAALVDSGNAAYRSGRFAEAARLFRRGTVEHPHQGATWFGLYMAEHALGNVSAADSALARAEALTPSLPSRTSDSIPGDSAGIH